MSTQTLMFIGDPHFQVSNITEVERFLISITNLAKKTQPTLIIIAGDLLHNHERLHTLALNKAYEFVATMRTIATTYVLVGNHDYIQNQQFLTENHWMNALKEWEDVVIVDKVIVDDTSVRGQQLVFVPYVPPGRFIEALETYPNTYSEWWKTASCIFAHQEFKGCKMGAIVSEDGDPWDEDAPPVVSGHIHSRQFVQKNVYYSGSAMQHAFGESEQNVIALLHFREGERSYELEEVDLKLPRKRIVYMDISDVDEYKIPNTDDKIKLTISGDQAQFKAFKKSRKYKELINKDIKVIFKPKRIELEKARKKDREYGTCFKEIMHGLIETQENTYLRNAYKDVVLFSSIS